MSKSIRLIFTFPHRDTKEITWREGGECRGKECQDYKGKACQEVMNLQFLLPKVPGLGVWQIDTGSIHSIMNINNCATMIRAMCGRVAWIPLTLSLEPTVVNNPEDGKKKTVYCMHLNYNKSAESLLLDSEKPRLQVLLALPSDDEAPEDRLLSNHTTEKKEEFAGKVEDDIDTFWPDDNLPGKAPDAPPAANPAGEKPKRDPNTIKNFGDLYMACKEDWSMARSTVWKELGYTSQESITELPKECYIKIAAIRK